MPASLAADAAPEHTCLLGNGSALEVLVAARDFIHAGWRLMHHPLYGNYRPHQQPYRSIILKHDSERSRLNLAAGGNAEQDFARIVPDGPSLQLIEAALDVYRADRVLEPCDVPQVFLRDSAKIDCALMHLPFEQTGWPVAI